MTHPVFRLAAGAIVAVCTTQGLGGCVSGPVYDFGNADPAQLLSPIETAGVRDGRARFREIFCERYAAGGAPDGSRGCAHYLHRLVDEPPPGDAPARAPLALSEVRFFIVPGYLGDAGLGGATALGPSINRLAAKGYRIEYLPVSGGGGGHHNANQLAAYFENRTFPAHEKLVVIGYSKGIIDLMHFLVEYPQFARRVDAMVGYAGAVNGSPLAEAYPEFLADVAMAVRGSDAGDRAGYDALKPSVQMTWLARNPLPPHIARYSLVAFTGRDNVSAALLDGYDRLAQINPKNDGLLIFYDQVLPRSTLLGYCNGDHWSVAMPFSETGGATAALLATRNAFPREAMLEAVLLYVRETL